MFRSVAAAFITLFVIKPAFAYMSVYCAVSQPGICMAAQHPIPAVAQQEANRLCQSRFPTKCSNGQVIGSDYSCASIAALSSNKAFYFAAAANSLAGADLGAQNNCSANFHGACEIVWHLCESDAVAVTTNVSPPAPAQEITQPVRTAPPTAPSRVDSTTRGPSIAQSRSDPNSPTENSWENTDWTKILTGPMLVEFLPFAVLGLFLVGVPIARFLVSERAPPPQSSLKQRRAPGLTTEVKHIEVLIARSQRMNWLNRVIFIIDARMGVGAEELDLIGKYRLGKTIVFDSARRERQNELARTHLEAAREKNTRTICLWREEVRGFFRRLWLLFRALISFLLGFLFIRITLAKLIRGTHVESKSLDTILAAKNAIERGAGDLKAYLEVAQTFDGRENLFEPS